MHNHVHVLNTADLHIGRRERGSPGNEERLAEGLGLWAHLLLGAALALPDVGGHDALHLLPQPRVLLELGKRGRGESHVHSGQGQGAPTPHQGPGAWDGGTHGTPKSREREAWGPTKPWPPPAPQVWLPMAFQGSFWF